MPRLLLFQQLTLILRDTILLPQYLIWCLAHQTNPGLAQLVPGNFQVLWEILWSPGAPTSQAQLQDDGLEKRGEIYFLKKARNY